METIHHETAVGAQVNAPQLTTLYAPDGETIQVEETKVATWLGRGFARTPIDLDALLSEVIALADALDDPWRAYVAACRAAGRVDNAAQDTARASIDLFTQACQRLHVAIHQTFPAPSGEE
jgi:hypothetical protein